MTEQDILTANHGTIVTFHATSDKGLAWIEENVDSDEPDHVVAEHRYAVDMIVAMAGDGLIVRDAASGRVACPANLEG